jgi:hypothetical protein
VKENTLLNFLPQPGPRERQLKRKSENPLFSAAETIRQADVDQARLEDRREMEEFLLEFRNLVEQAASLDGRAEADDILRIKAQLEQFYPRACGQAGDNSTFISALDKLIATITQTLLSAAGNDEEAISRIREDQESSDLHLKISQYPLVSDLLSEQDIIPEAELAATLLGEDETSVSAALLIFSPEQLMGIIEESTQLLATHEDVVKHHPEYRKRLEQLQEWHASLSS